MIPNFETKEDYNISPFTGWTRTKWEELAEKMIVGLQPFVTPGKGGLALPNPVRWMDAFLPEPEKMQSFYWLEGYTRTRVLLASWMAGTGKQTIISGGKTINILDQFIEGLLSASDPSHEEFIGDRYGNNQWIAETSAVALAIYLAKDLIWPKLSVKQQQQIVSWLITATGKQIPNNNWYTFVANLHYALKALGEKYDKKELDFCMNKIEGFYLGDGWFMDGDASRGFSVEQYNAWGFHYFLPAYVYMGEEDQTRKTWIIECLRNFVVNYERFLGANGSIAMWGRSWAYRPALTVPFIWAEILGVSPIPSGETRRLVSGQMNYYLNHDYFYDNMTPTMGYTGENLQLIDPYSQYGSPYWGSGVFLNLLLKPDHPFWTEKEKPLPVERESYCFADRTIGVLVAGNHESGEVQLINHRLWHQKEGPGTKYAKKYTNFAYSTDFGIDLKRTENGYNCDNMLSVSPDGVKFSQRIIPHFIKIDEGYAASYHYPLAGFPFIADDNSKTFSADKKIEIPEDNSVKVTTQTLIKFFLQIRVHTLETERELEVVREGGFALNYSDNPPQQLLNEMSVGFWKNGRGSFVKGLWGFDGVGKNGENKGDNNSNTLNGFSITPVVTKGQIEPGKHIFVSLVGTWFGPESILYDKLNVVKSTIVENGRVVVNFSDDTVYVFTV
ncbi:DUF2264 domain-containing protein [candidate division KSB1 bacterium]|nr:DUF2264 domain-containing protein [candidate division KSB1 bacterium]